MTATVATYHVIRFLNVDTGHEIVNLISTSLEDALERFLCRYHPVNTVSDLACSFGPCDAAGNRRRTYTVHHESTDAVVWSVDVEVEALP